MGKDDGLPEEIELQKGDSVEPRIFDVPVDSEHKSKVFKLWSFNRPHHLSFQLNWFCFFTAFLSTFAAAPLITIIRQDLNLTRQGISGAAIASVTGTIFSRVSMGTFVDAFGPRYGHALLLCGTSTAVFSMAQVTTSAGFIVCRCVIGFSLATFVCCQFWGSIMFSPRVVGTANAFAGGWGNMGGGATQLIMPYLFEAIAKHVPDYEAWRWAFFIPGAMHVTISLLVLTLGQDMPDGNYAQLKKSGEKEKANSVKEFIVAITNYRTLILMFTYGYCFGVELTVDNVIAEYFADHFGKGIVAAGNFAAIFGLFNLISRPMGGVISDMVAKPWGMRGRLWWLFICQMAGGLLCLALGLVEDSFSATLAILIAFSLFVQGACGASFGVVPFVSRRALGLVCGLVGAGGNVGGAITQAIFFTPKNLAVYDGFKWMGLMICGVTCFQLFLYWPQWGGLLCPPKKGATEEDYFFAEYSAEEREAGKHLSASKFVNESKSQRGMNRLQKEAVEKQKQEENGAAIV